MPGAISQCRCGRPEPAFATLGAVAPSRQRRVPAPLAASLPQLQGVQDRGTIGGDDLQRVTGGTIKNSPNCLGCSLAVDDRRQKPARHLDHQTAGRASRQIVDLVPSGTNQVR